jgi:hypothetical protein
MRSQDTIPKILQYFNLRTGEFQSFYTSHLTSHLTLNLARRINKLFQFNSNNIIISLASIRQCIKSSSYDNYNTLFEHNLANLQSVSHVLT